MFITFIIKRRVGDEGVTIPNNRQIVVVKYFQHCTFNQEQMWAYHGRCKCVWATGDQQRQFRIGSTIPGRTAPLGQIKCKMK